MGPIFVILSDPTVQDDYFQIIKVPGHPMPICGVSMYLVCCKTRNGTAEMWKSWFQALKEAMITQRKWAVEQGLVTELESKESSCSFDGDHAQLEQAVDPNTVKEFWDVYIRLWKLVAAATFISQPADTGPSQRASKKLTRNQKYHEIDPSLARAYSKALDTIFGSKLGERTRSYYVNLLCGFANTSQRAMCKSNIIQSFASSGHWPTNPKRMCEIWFGMKNQLTPGLMNLILNPKTLDRAQEVLYTEGQGHTSRDAIL